MRTIFMKPTTLVALLTLSLSLSTQAALYSFAFNSGFANLGNVPDGNVSGWSDQRTLSGIIYQQIVSVDVKLNITGGYNGDLYAYVSHDNGLKIGRADVWTAVTGR